MQTERQQESLGVTPEQVREYLRVNPGFLADNQDLLRILTPPQRRIGDNIIDFQHRFIERLQQDVNDLDALRDSIIATTRSNYASQQHAHVAVLVAMEAQSLSHLVHIITRDWVDIMGMDAVALCLADPFPGDASFATAGISLVEQVDLDRLFADTAVVLRTGIKGSRDLYGAAAGLVRAEALIKLDAGADRPAGILAMGSRHPSSFAPGQGTELLRFLGKATERLLNQWLKAAKD